MMRCHFFRRNGIGLVGTFSIALLQGAALVTVLGGFQRSAIANPIASSEFRISQAIETAQTGSLSLEDSGDAVTELQTRLADLGFFQEEITGYFGTATQDAVIAFQQSLGLTADGVVGPSTWAALQPASSDTANDNLLQVGDSGIAISDLQSRLSSLGYYQGAIDGVFGSLTEAAVIAFQQAQGLNPDGVVGASTQDALSQTAVAAQPPISTAPDPIQPLPSQPALAPSLPTAAPVPAPALAPIAQLPPADTEGPYSVLDLQWKLRNQGFYYGPLDGVMGTETQRAISEAQAEYGLRDSDLQDN
ncbi:MULTISPECIES: peptidoglycan-binding protein [unclassified Leptolyngbya]|uniref:peptidoglycan-binding domain-containing protein n=1 Tax=unclassified Leptolyngbya TaxID=2650499 RepID=UPI001687CC06|nr:MULTISPECIES: peptidoglycan-binding protein [unclassified Leptolyngbya]MBD1910104.1 peptidoglycan-binding protein [Leptolyngbya sp. FACHB-8]MBD2156876.1 peptidoglycan-binding protein [Leptolyngbya sp. FACHB-16]